MKYLPVRISTLRGTVPPNFDIFIKMGDKYVHYLRKEDPLDLDRIVRLKTKGVKKVFITEEGETSYLKFMDSGLDDLKKANVTTEEKGQIAQSTLTDIAENSKKSLESEVNYKATEQRVNKVMDFLLGEKGAIKNVLGNSGVALDTYMHSANVATLSLSLAPRFDIKDSNALLELGMAALMHDIGLEGLDLNFDTPPEQYTPEQLTLYQTHTRKGAEKAADKPFVNPKVVDLIMNHHEVGEGLGFPNKKRLATLPMSQQVLNLCNSYDESCTVYNLSPLEAMKQFYVDKMGLFDLKMVDVLKEILKVG